MRVVVGLGSNIEPRRNLESCLQRLARDATVLRQSRSWWTPALPSRSSTASPPGAAASGTVRTPRPVPAPAFLNAVAIVDTPRAPVAMRRWLRAIEHDHGRTRHDDPDAPRTLDLDVLAFDLADGKGWQVDSVEAARPYNLLPLVEVLPDLRLDDGRTVREHARANPLPAAYPWTEGSGRLPMRPAAGRDAGALSPRPPRPTEARRREATAAPGAHQSP